MQSRIENIKWHLQQMPMLRALLPIVVGVIIADRVTFPLWSVAVGFVLSLVVAWWWRARNVANLYLFVAFMLLGVMAVELRRGSDHSSVEHELFGRGALAEIAIEPLVGPEFVTGSTRLKSGTAQKLVCNMITTITMIKMGRVKGNKMVNMQLSNKKLVDRGTRMLVDELGLEYDKAKDLLLLHGSVKKAMDA